MTGTGDWQGGVGDVWAQLWPETDRSLAPLAARLLAEAQTVAPAAKAILDIGCGAGTTTLGLADQFPAARLLGIDISPSLIAVADSRRAARPNVAFAVADAARFDDPAFRPDLLVSRHGVMFFDDPVAAFAALRAAAAPDARLIFTCFRGVADNDWARSIATIMPPGAAIPSAETPFAPGPFAPGPFAFADAERVAAILAAAGWAADPVTPVDFTYRVGDGDDPVGQAMRFLRRIGPAARAMAALPPDAAAAMAARLEALLRARLSGGTVDFGAAAWLFTARAGETKA